MKFTCDKSVLLSGINKVKQAVSKFNNLTALQSILIKAEDGKLTFSATDFELAIQCTLHDVSIEEPGEALVPAKILSDIVRRLNGELVVELVSDNMMIYFGESVVRLNTLDVSEFPEISKDMHGNLFEIGSGVVKTALKKIMFAMSSTEETRPVFCGVLLKSKDGILDFVACDTHRLAVYKHQILSDLEFEAVITRKTVKELFRLIGKEETPIRVIFSESEIQFSFGDITILSRLIQVKYPNYKEVFPSHRLASVTLNKQNLIAAIKRASIFTDPYQRIVSIEGKEKLNISATMELFGSLDEKLSADHEGEEIKVFLNIEWILQGLSTMDDELVTINYFGSFSPITMHEDNFIQLLLPVRVSA